MLLMSVHPAALVPWVTLITRQSFEPPFELRAADLSPNLLVMDETCGCAKVALVAISESAIERAVATTSWCSSVSSSRFSHNSEEFSRFLAKFTEHQATKDAFLAGSAARRAAIVTKFAAIRDAVNSAERAALVEFDTSVEQTLKALSVDSNALEVRVQQYSAQLMANIEAQCSGLELPVTTPPRIVDVVVLDDAILTLITSAWKLVTMSDGDVDELVRG
jgi:hypothetical protein